MASSTVVQTFIESAPRFADIGIYTSFALKEGMFIVYPAIAANLSVDALQSLFDPILAALNASGMYFGKPSLLPEYSSYPFSYSYPFGFVNHSMNLRFLHRELRLLP